MPLEYSYDFERDVPHDYNMLGLLLCFIYPIFLAINYMDSGVFHTGSYLIIGASVCLICFFLFDSYKRYKLKGKPNVNRMNRVFVHGNEDGFTFKRGQLFKKKEVQYSEVDYIRIGLDHVIFKLKKDEFYFQLNTIANKTKQREFVEYIKNVQTQIVAKSKAVN